MSKNSFITVVFKIGCFAFRGNSIENKALIQIASSRYWYRQNNLFSNEWQSNSYQAYSTERNVNSVKLSFSYVSIIIDCVYGSFHCKK